MKKISLIALLLTAALLLQECKKDTVTETVTSAQLMIASINDSTWTSDTVTASVAYTAATKSKVFTCTAIADNKKVTFSAVSTNTPSTQGFTLSTFNLNATSAVSMAYYQSEKDAAGNTVFVQRGTALPGSGGITVTAVDSVKKLITGTYYFTTRSETYDSNGNIASVSVWQVQSGGFNNMPYTFTSN